MNVYGIPVDTQWLVKFLLKVLFDFLDRITDGASLNEMQRKLVRTAYYLAVEWGQWYAEQTDTPHDDEAVKHMIAYIEDLADEGGFDLPILPQRN